MGLLSKNSGFGDMGPRAVFFLLFVMVVNCTHANARSLVDLDIISTSMDDRSEGSKSMAKNEQMCTLCEEYTTKVVEYFSETEIQSEIVNTLHQACSYLNAFKHKCVSLVDYYAPIFFMEIATIQPALFCEKVNLCEMLPVSLQQHDDICTVCHHLVAEVLNKLQDPDTQLEIIETLLKGCNKVENFVQECKKLVFQYGPIILANAEKFLESTDICAAAHVCKAGRNSNSLGEFLLDSA